MAKKSKSTFHKPQTYGEKLVIPMTPVLHILSIASLVIQVAMTVFGAYAASTRYDPEQVFQFGMPASYMYLVLPVLGWVLTLGFRLGCRYLPLDMWRMPVKVREGVRLTKGRLLKKVALVVELETAIAFFYVCLSLYAGYVPSDLVMTLWVVAIIVSVWRFGVLANRYADGLEYKLLETDE